LALSTEFNRNIHQRLLDGDPIAPSELVVAYLEPLTRWLHTLFRHLQDEQLLVDAATDALLNYIEHPARFDPTKSALPRYLRMSAKRDLLNALQREQRRTKRAALARKTLKREQQRIVTEGHAESVELGARSGTIIQEDDEKTVVTQDVLEHMFEAITEPRDRQLLQLLRDGVRKTAAYAEILGIQDRNTLEQRKLVKQHKDRLKKQLERLGARRRG
jgi:RNA polymerase sigma-70 factor (ECF subfamily)